jgi:type IV conjugative transfer system coupling protein TraD
MLKTFTRGGQVTLHNFHMIRQVLNVTILATLILGILGFGAKSWSDFTPFERQAAFSYCWADLKLNTPFVKEEKKNSMTQFYTFENGTKGVVYTKAILHDLWHQNLVQRIEHQLIDNAWLALWWMAGMFLLICGTWVWRGRANKLMESKALQKFLEKEKIASSFKIGGVSLRLNSETQHLLFCGTTGTGKSNCFTHLFPQIRDQKQRAIIVDTTGEFVSRYYREGKDVLINPFDERSVSWNPWVECEYPYHYDEIAYGFIPQTGNDRFWSESARTVFSEALMFLANEDSRNVDELYSLLLEDSLLNLYKALINTPAASLLDPSGDKTAMSIRSHLAPYLKVLRYLPKNKPVFSVRDWVKNTETNSEHDSWLFITSTPDQRETLKPLLTGLMTIAFNALMNTKPDPHRRLWFVIDELISLNKQEVLPKALAEIRKYGGCIAAGIQNIPQLQEQYGNAETKSLTSLFNTKVVFRNGDPETARHMSQMLGEQEVKETIEGLSYGAHQMRDGVSLNEQKRMKPVVSATDIMALNDLEAYLKLPGNLPITHLKFEVNILKNICPAFVPQSIEGRGVLKRVV